MASLRRSFYLQFFLCVTNARAFLHSRRRHELPWSPPSFTCARHPNNSAAASFLRARPKSKWDSLLDDDDDHDDASAEDAHFPPDMAYTMENIRRQADTYDRLEAVGGRYAVKDVYVRAPREKEWWLLGKIAHVSDVTPEQAIERQWPLLERHAWALRLPPAVAALKVGAPYEAWYAPGDTERDAARNDPSVRFTRAFNYVERYNGADVPAASVGFVGKTYDAQRGEPPLFVERNVVDGSCLEGREVEGDWVLKSE